MHVVENEQNRRVLGEVRVQEFKHEAKQRLLRGLRQRLAADFGRAQLRLQLEQFFHIFEILRAETETLIVMAQNFRLFMLLAAL